MKLKPGWLKRQIEKARKDIKSWPAWMRREAKLPEKRGGYAAEEQE